MRVHSAAVSVRADPYGEPVKLENTRVVRVDEMAHYLRALAAASAALEVRSQLNRLAGRAEVAAIGDQIVPPSR